MSAPHMARRLAVGATGALAAAIFTTLPLAASAVTVTVSDTTIYPGQTLSVSATGLTDNERYRICATAQNGTTVCSGVYTATGTTMSRVVTVPDTLAPGTYTGSLRDADTGAVLTTVGLAVTPSPAAAEKGSNAPAGNLGEGEEGKAKGLPNTGGDPSSATRQGEFASLTALALAAVGAVWIGGSRGADKRRHAHIAGRR